MSIYDCLKTGLQNKRTAKKDKSAKYLAFILIKRNLLYHL
jgi:hypothetical protein